MKIPGILVPETPPFPFNDIGLHDTIEAQANRVTEKAQTQTLSTGLGIFGVALGAFQIFSAASIARFLGIDQTYRHAIRLSGARQIASGLGVLAEYRSPTPLWAQVGGQALDMAGLSLALKGRPARRSRVGFALAAVAGVALLDMICARNLEREQLEAKLQRVARFPI